MTSYYCQIKQSLLHVYVLRNGIAELMRGLYAWLMIGPTLIGNMDGPLSIVNGLSNLMEFFRFASVRLPKEAEMPRSVGDILDC